MDFYFCLFIYNIFKISPRVKNIITVLWFSFSEKPKTVLISDKKHAFVTVTVVTIKEWKDDF